MSDPSKNIAVAKRIAVAATIAIGPISGFLDLVTVRNINPRMGGSSLHLADLASLTGRDVGDAVTSAFLWSLFGIPMIWFVYALARYLLLPVHPEPKGANAQPSTTQDSEPRVNG